MDRLNRHFAAYKWWYVGFLVLLGVILRFAVIRYGHNFDFDSYKIAGDLVANGKNVYANTKRYNYGPIWFTALGVYWQIAHMFSNPDLVFRLLIVGTLTLADLGIWYVLYRKVGVVASLVFILNPISIIITGFHNQFDNIAVLFALSSALYFDRSKVSKMDRAKLISLVLLGVSLIVKHIFFIFPFWLALKQRQFKYKLMVLFVPVGIFLVSFVPWLSGGGLEGIKKHVFLYRSWANAPLWHQLPIVADIIPSMILFLGTVALLGLVWRKVTAFKSALLYTICIVAFSSSIANQYIAIAAAGASAFFNLPFALYMLYGGILLSTTSPFGLRSDHLRALLPEQLTATVDHNIQHAYDVIVAMLFIGLIWYIRKWSGPKMVKALYTSLVRELRWQRKSL